MVILLAKYCTQKYLQSAPGRLSAGHQRPQQHQNEDYTVVAMWYTMKDNPSVQNRAAFISPPFATH